MFFIGLVTGFCLLVAYYFSIRLHREYQARSNGCSPPKKYPHKEPLFGLDVFLAAGKTMKEHRMLPEIANRFTNNGQTFQSLNLGRIQVNSIKPENVHTVFSSKSTEWGVRPMRLAAQEFFCGRGFITTDGEDWVHSKALLKPGFHKDNISNLEPLEELFQIMLSHIPKDGSTVDLLPLFSNLYLDMATWFLFGESIGALSQNMPSHAEGVLEAFDYAMRGTGIRIVLGPLRFLYRDPKWFEACKKVHRFADHYVNLALEYRQNFLTGKTSTGEQNKILLYSMAEQTGDGEDLRYQILQAHMAAQETTGNLLANVFFLLSRHPKVWQKLREEVDSIGDNELDWNYVSRLKYVRMVLHEALRIYPIIPHLYRTALTDTTLPVGGGFDGKSPINAPKGTIFFTSSYALQRNTTIWGSDAEKFIPERWENNFKPAPGEFIPFGAGPRICMGQQKALVESAYIIVRMIQEFSVIESCDDRQWTGQLQLTVKNAYGCLVSLKPNVK